MHFLVRIFPVPPSVLPGVIFDSSSDPLPNEIELGGLEWNNREWDRIPFLLALPRASQPGEVLSGAPYDI